MSEWEGKVPISGVNGLLVSSGPIRATGEKLVLAPSWASRPHKERSVFRRVKNAREEPRCSVVAITS